MTNTTTQHHLDTTDQSGLSGRAPVPAPMRHRRRRLGRVAIATATAAVVVAGGIGVGAANAAPARLASVKPAPSQFQLVCDLGSGGVSEIEAALDDCLVPVRSQPFSPIAAIAVPAHSS
jgi:hypothetical protein